MSVVENEKDIVEVRGRKMAVRWLHPAVGDWVSALMVKDGDDAKILCKAAALIRLNGFWKCHLLYWLTWRWYYYVRQYNARELTPLFEVAQKNGIGGSTGLLKRYNITDRVEHDEKADDQGGSKAYPSRTSVGAAMGNRSEARHRHRPLTILGLPVSGMMYYVNWVLTNAQLELLAADVSVVDYHYGDKKKKKKKGEYDDTPADSESVRKAGDDWLERHADDGGVVDMKQLLGGFQQGVGVKISSE